MNAQISYIDEIIVDNFAGGGGASTGIELATGRPVAIAINHDPAAILMHRTNHPYTEHLQASVWDVDPVEVCAGRPVGLAWFSPDCKHFSKAKGGPLVSKNIRGLSWVVMKWGLAVRPRVMIMENVEEIQSWGPLIPMTDEKTGRPLKIVTYMKGGKLRQKTVVAKEGEIVPEDEMAMMPDPARKGETFQGFISILTTGISPEHPAFLECCKFLRIEPDSEDAGRLIRGLGYQVEFRELVAADFGAPTTRKRFVLVARNDGKPIVWPKRTHAPAGSHEVRAGKCEPWRSAAEIIDWSVPMYSIFATKQEIKERYGVNAVRPLADNTLRRIIRGVDKFTIKSGDPFIIPTGYGERKGQSPRVHDIHAPVPTVVSTCKQNLVQPKLTPITLSNTGGSTGAPADQPVSTIRTAGGQILAAAHLAQYHTEKGENPRGSGLNGPVPTVDGSNRHALISAQLAEYYGNGQPIGIKQPMRTVTSHDRECVVCAHMDKYYAGGYSGAGNSMDEPVTTITVEPRQSLVAAHVVKFKGTNLGQHPDDPLQTVTASMGEFAVCTVRTAPCARGADLGHWPEVRALQNKYCGYRLAEDEILLIWICGAWHYIRDIAMRMLTPRELYAAMGFPPDYIIDRDYNGSAYPKSQQVARCGNAVCPPLATAVVRANLPEWCRTTYGTMDALTRAIAI